jgi:hypothetical protein
VTQPRRLGASVLLSRQGELLASIGTTLHAIKIRVVA